MSKWSQSFIDTVNKHYGENIYKKQKKKIQDFWKVHGETLKVVQKVL